MDILTLEDLQVETVIGTLDWERQIHQKLKLTLELGIDAKKAAQADQIEDALNYADVANRVIGYVEESEFQLIETLAENLSKHLFEHFPIPWLRIQISKPGAVPKAKNVKLTIERTPS